MLNSELQRLLNEYPDDAEVKVVATASPDLDESEQIIEDGEVLLVADHRSVYMAGSEIRIIADQQGD
jgi:hypothetical protein